MRYNIEVTQKDIDQARVKDSSRCVVATAVARSIPGAHRIEVDIQSIRFSLDGQRIAYVTPYQVTGYIVAFDAGDEIQPFKFRLDEDKSINVRQTKKTPAGTATQKAHHDAASRAKRLQRAEQKLEILIQQHKDSTLPPPSPAQIQVAREVVKEQRVEAKTAAERRDAVVAAYANVPKTTEDATLPKAPARVFKTRAREYGHRMLRINQER